MPRISLQFLDWRRIVLYADPAYHKNGTELALCYVPRTNHRFALSKVRWGLHDFQYQLRDAETVSDADVKAGIRPAVVFEAYTIREIEDWLNERL